MFLGWYVATQKKDIFPILFWTFFVGIVGEGLLAVLQVVHQGALQGIWYFLGERYFTAGTPGIANASIHGELILRPYATFPHPNVLAGYMGIALLFFLITALFPKKRVYRAVSIAAAVFGCIILVLTLSRVAIVTFFLLTGIILLLRFPKQKYVIILLYCVLPMGIFLFSSFLSGRFFDVQGYMEALGLRDALMQAAWRMILAHPLFGVGLGNFLPTLPSFLTGRILFGFLQPVHTIFLLVLAETGIIGLGLFIYVLAQALRISFQGWIKQKNMVSHFAFFALVAICLIGMTDHYFLTLQQGQLLFALVLGLCFRTNITGGSR